jgi:hypothetical protein
MLGWDQLGKREQLRLVTPVTHQRGRRTKLRRGITRDLILGSRVLYGELPTTTTASRQTSTTAPIRIRGAVGSCSWAVIGNYLAPQATISNYRLPIAGSLAQCI